MPIPARFIKVVNSYNDEVALSRIEGVSALNMRARSDVIISTESTIIPEGGDRLVPLTAEFARIRAGGDAADSSSGTGTQLILAECLDENFDECQLLFTTNGASASGNGICISSGLEREVLRINSATGIGQGTHGGFNAGSIIIETVTTNIILSTIPINTNQSHDGFLSIPRGYLALPKTLDAVFEVGQRGTVDLYARFNPLQLIAPFAPRVQIFTIVLAAGKFTRENITGTPFAGPLDFELRGASEAGTGPIGISAELQLVLVKIDT